MVVQGITLDSTTPLRIICAACKNLGRSSNGSKMKCLKRLHQRIRAQELLAQKKATASLENEISTSMPTDDQGMKHYLTRPPYASWCEFCIANDLHQSPECSTFVCWECGFFRLWLCEQVGLSFTSSIML